MSVKLLFLFLSVCSSVLFYVLYHWFLLSSWHLFLLILFISWITIHADYCVSFHEEQHRLIFLCYFYESTSYIYSFCSSLLFWSFVSIDCLSFLWWFAFKTLYFVFKYCYGMILIREFLFLWFAFAFYLLSTWMRCCSFSIPTWSCLNAYEFIFFFRRFVLFKKIISNLFYSTHFYENCTLMIRTLSNKHYIKGVKSLIRQNQRCCTNVAVPHLQGSSSYMRSIETSMSQRLHGNRFHSGSSIHHIQEKHPELSKYITDYKKSLAYLEPNIARDLHPLLNPFHANEISIDYPYPVYWQCPQVSEHYWKDTIKNYINYTKRYNQPRILSPLVMMSVQ